VTLPIDAPALPLYPVKVGRPAWVVTLSVTLTVDAAVAVAAGTNVAKPADALSHKGDGNPAKSIKANTASDEAAHRAAKTATKTEGKTIKADSQAKEANAKLVAAAELEPTAGEEMDAPGSESGAGSSSPA
jgi:hypothetical protein